MSQKIVRAENDLKYCDDVIERKKRLELGFVDLGHRLLEIHSRKMWQGRWEDFDDFCVGGMKMEKSLAYKLMAIYRVFVLEHGVEPARLAEAGGWTRLDAVVSRVTDRKTADHWLDQAIHAHSRKDLKQLVRAESTGVDPMSCRHSEKDCERWVMVKCKKCGETWREYKNEKV